MKTKVVNIGDISIGGNNPFVLIAGPCAMESEEIVMSTAQQIKAISDKTKIPFVFKCSLDKANRTSIKSYRGIGLEQGLLLLEKVKKVFDIPVTTDIHLPEQADLVCDVVDLIQIPAFLCRQTDLIAAASKSGKPLNIKKAQFLAPWDMEHVINKALEVGNDNIIVTERGTMFGYNNLVVDMTGLIEMKKKLNCPIVFDGTHSVQKPGGNGTTSGGNNEYVEYLCKAAIACGVDSVFLEVHPNPSEALCDGANMVPLDNLSSLLIKLKNIDELIKGEIFGEHFCVV